MTWNDFYIPLFCFVIYGIGWTHGYSKGKDAGIYQELTRRAHRGDRS